MVRTAIRIINGQEGRFHLVDDDWLDLKEYVKMSKDGENRPFDRRVLSPAGVGSRPKGLFE